MKANSRLNGVFVAAVTPLTKELAPDLEAMPQLLSFYARRGCHGALILGTTGEGPSFSPRERADIYRGAARIWEEYPDFVLMAGTGTPSLQETIQLNKTVFDLGYDAVVVLPPYYFRTATEEGLYQWFKQVIEASIPADKHLMGYHIPQVSGVALTPNLLSRLAADFPAQFGGIKDSSGDLGNTQTVAAQLPDSAILVGNDRLLTPALQSGGAGSITALANLVSPLLREIYDAYQQGKQLPEVQQKVDDARQVMDALAPFPASLKALLAKMHNFPLWPVKPPLMPFADAQIEQAAQQLGEILA